MKTSDIAILILAILDSSILLLAPLADRKLYPRTRQVVLKPVKLRYFSDPGNAIPVYHFMLSVDTIIATAFISVLFLHQSICFS